MRIRKNQWTLIAENKKSGFIKFYCDIENILVTYVGHRKAPPVSFDSGQKVRTEIQIKTDVAIDIYAASPNDESNAIYYTDRKDLRDNG